jgi:hypothetical protein
VSKEVFDKINPVDYDKTETLTKKEKIEWITDNFEELTSVLKEKNND